MSWLDIVILAVVQGIAEFLPISSSGHLVVVTELLGKMPATDVNVVLHAGTLVSILVFFWRRVLELLRSDRRVILPLLVGTIPAAVVGLWVREFHQGVLENGLLTGLMLIVTGLILIATTRWGTEGRGYSDLGLAGALLIGVFQAAALLPGISRSGSTIFAGLLAGLDRRSAATFSFLLAIPAIAGASVLEISEMMSGASRSAPLGFLALGCLISFLVGLAALGWLFRWIEKGKLHYFAFWCIALGIGVVIWQV